MGFLSWLFGHDKSAEEQVPVPDFRGPGEFEFEVVGESNYQSALSEIYGGTTDEGHSIETTAFLFHEDDNPHDPKAVVVVIDSSVVGYLSRQHAREFRNVLADAGHPGSVATCRAKIVGGWDRGDGDVGDFGVRLDLPIK